MIFSIFSEKSLQKAVVVLASSLEAARQHSTKCDSADLRHDFKISFKDAFSGLAKLCLMTTISAALIDMIMGRKTIRSELPVRFVGAGHFIDVRWIFQ
jgi:hypothetical protein